MFADNAGIPVEETLLRFGPVTAAPVASRESGQDKQPTVARDEARAKR